MFLSSILRITGTTRLYKVRVSPKKQDWVTQNVNKEIYGHKSDLQALKMHLGGKINFIVAHNSEMHENVRMRRCHCSSLAKALQEASTFKFRILPRLH